MTQNSFRTEGDINFSDNRQIWQLENIDADTQYWLDEDRKYFFAQSLSTPCLDVLDECYGVYIEDIQGKKYLDFHGNNVHQIGFRNPAVIEAIKEQLDKLPFSTRRYTNIEAIKFAQKLVSLTDNKLSKVLFAPSGALAVSTAIKIARAYTGKNRILSVWDSFHGASIDTISVGGEALFRNGIGPLIGETEHFPPPSTYRGIFSNENDDMKYAEYIEYIIEKDGNIAALISETIRNTDVIIPSQEYWKKVRKICDEHNVLLILDEIPTALGRTGEMFAYENYDIIPDIVCLGKGLGGGVIPMAGILANEKLDNFPTMALGHYTFEKNPLGAIAGLATINYIEKSDLLNHVKELEEYTRDFLNYLKNKYSIIGDVRGIGLLWGIELVEDRATKKPANDSAEKIMYNCLENGLSFKISQGNIITLSPALIITKNELDNAFEILENAFKSL